MTPVSVIEQIPTARGIRLQQHGTILSELVRQPGPTDTTADILAALVSVFGVASPVALLGFAAGSVVAPLRALGCQQAIETVDLDRAGYRLFTRVCGSYQGQLDFHHGDAVSWLRARKNRFGMILEDLSIPQDNDVTIPEVVWMTLPKLMRSRLQPHGIAIFNLLRPPDLTWAEILARVTEPFDRAAQVFFDDFENRIIIASATLPPIRKLGRQLRGELARLGSTLSTRVSLRSL